ncbi:MAG: DUF5399 family protein [Simkaniaceae bacterium]|nr:DUF5399 family protein [Simkaniaceae bacterium]
MTESKKIYDYPIETSIKYAESKAYFDEKIITESSNVAMQTSIEVTMPGYGTEFDHLFETRKSIQWADFNIPKEYNTQAKSDLFTQALLMPSLGPAELRDVKREAIVSQMNTYQKTLSSTPAADFEKRLSLEADLECGEKLLALFATITPKDKDLADIAARKNQYVAA